MENVIEFWFEKTNRKNWFKISKKFDIKCKEKFNDLLTNFNLKKINLNKSLEVLGLIILLDQIPRNIFRGKPKAYKYDNLALKLCLDNLILSHELDGWYRIFFLMPLKHVENLEIQKMNIMIWTEITDIDFDFDELYKKNLIECKKHFEIIKKFGRFPKRNIILSRLSTNIELEYLNKNNKSFI